MIFYLKIWRQESRDFKGKMIDYTIDNISEDTSFLEMLDALNEQLILKDQSPIAFDHDCREGICGMCSLMINGQAHGPQKQTTTCQLHMRSFKDGDSIVIEPWRASAFPVLKDLVVDRVAFDEIITAGGFIDVNTGAAGDAKSLLIGKQQAELAMDAASCIGCGACVASCKNASAMLFVAAKVSQYALLPQGQIEAKKRVQSMVFKMDALGFGNCSNESECEAVCPKGIAVSNITRLNREYVTAKLSE